MNKAAIEKFAVWARTKLISEITYKAGLLGISDKGIAEPLPQSSNDLQLFDIGTKNYAEVSGAAIQQRSALVAEIKQREKSANYHTAFTSVIEEVAYTWFNRLVAIRFMEVNDYLPSRIRVLSSENAAKSEPDFVTNPFDTDLAFTAYEQDRIVQLKDENKLDELFRLLFIKQCNKLHDVLPDLFEKTDDYTELLLTISFTDKDGVVYHLTHDISEDDFNVEKEGQVEIIGWLYQYYNTELKVDTFAQLKKNVKISKERIPAATQLFTPDWIVRYMVENSLGRLWVEGHPNDSLKSEWKYYLEEAEQEESVKAELAKIRREYSTLNPEDIKIIDPCMGSGHILVYAFDVLMQIYESCGYTQRDAAKSIIVNNLFGLDIDKRAYQLSYFAILMKARQYNRRILNEEVSPNLFVIEDSSALSSDTIEYIAKGNPHIRADLKSIADELSNAKEYGSMIDVTPVDFAAIYARIEEIRNGDLDIFSVHIPERITPIIRQAEVMAQKYDVVVTNPPYMALSGANNRLSDYIKTYFPDSKADLFAVFIERCRKMTKVNRLSAMITQHAWMFLSSYEKLRVKLQSNDTVNMVHLGARAFEEIGGEVVQTTSFVTRNSHIAGYKGTYCRLIEPTSQQGKENMFLAGENRYIAQQSNFSKIPGSPVAYWVSEKFITAFDYGTALGAVTKIPKGLSTGSVDLFMRFWFEVDQNCVDYHSSGCKDSQNRGYKWFPYAKGGAFRRWNGNLEYVVNWENDGYSVKHFVDERGKQRSRPQNTPFYFKECLTYSAITSYKYSVRYINNCIFGGGGDSIHSDPETNMYVVMGLLNTNVAQNYLSVISPTMNFEVDHIKRVPLIRSNRYEERITELVKQCIEISKADWDSFETSWDFQRHPLLCFAPHNSMPEVPMNYTIAAVFDGWSKVCEDRFNRLKANEEELNRIFIEIYGLQDELSPEVEDKDVTVRKADLSRDIRSLISYAVGCMFGRYSLDTDGLAYAGGAWDSSKYSTFLPDEDNCLPITDEEYFKDDIVGRFVEFIKVVYGEETLEENLDFIAKALGNKGNTSREVIRNYFLNDFIKDHIKMYQKRPIYWLFDSGKQNGFKALVYMHRWNADTIGNMRVEYLHRMQRVYESEIARMQETIDNSSNSREISVAEKRKDKLQKQLKETKDYDAKIAHLALSRIDIDLDDGVKVNYEKVQTVDGKKMPILAKI